MALARAVRESRTAFEPEAERSQRLLRQPQRWPVSDYAYALVEQVPPFARQSGLPRECDYAA